MRSVFVLFLLLLCTSLLAATDDDSLRVSPSHNFSSDKWLAKDKADHFMASLFLTGMGYYAAKKELGYSDPASRNLAISFSLSFGLGKEIYDKTSKRGQASLKDIVADILGIGFGYIIINMGTF